MLHYVYSSEFDVLLEWPIMWAEFVGCEMKPVKLKESVKHQLQGKQYLSAAFIFPFVKLLLWLNQS